MSLNRILCILTLVFLSMTASALDQKKLDSLKAELSHVIPDSTRSRLLFELAQEVGSSDTILAYSYLEQAKILLNYKEMPEA